MEMIFARLARAEMEEAKRYYERQQRGLGREFILEASQATKRILEQPLAWQIEIAPVRRFIFNRFPYKMLHHRAGGSPSTPQSGLLGRPARQLTTR